MTRKEFNRLVNLQMELIQGNLEHSKRTLRQDIKALDVSRSFYLNIVNKMTTRGRFCTSCFAAVTALSKMINLMNTNLAIQADIAIDAGEFSGRFW